MLIDADQLARRLTARFIDCVFVRLIVLAAQLIPFVSVSAP